MYNKYRRYGKYIKFMYITFTYVCIYTHAAAQSLSYV